ncbi:hypothetical protein SLNWT_3674 [Streptomyces albus]|uniref:Uncharacterized protein n=1 Tax=Streptomyces albus (strain ATCC 21838 / DSM 41398 / FERM P-419 / JCM 4703 / NBRC 107858) TaxID=1081613 RepID=A0A0B5EXU5_STRA4|nr:hypothetical protein SLNWT_3674 [Streptomyces albus]AOU78355.1 hypothetical protein SLNHY_3664 [Streptomyces albus]AYN34105.1 hypothetical protein DUI70_3604 [Streptomyces albus]
MLGNAHRAPPPLSLRPDPPCPLSYGTALTNTAPDAAGDASVLCAFSGASTGRVPVHGRPPEGVSQSGYPQAVWMNCLLLWRTPRNLCTTRWTAL